VHCQSENFKVTTAADLALAGQMLGAATELRVSGV
jgi:2-C-methyl-D-erythritol 4-phosphate cytidylyltransferase